MDYLQFITEQMGISSDFLWLFVVIMIWSAIWKGLALWKAARKGAPVWFIIFLVVNTIGILEILYIKIFSEMKKNNFRNKKVLKKKKRR